MMKKTLNEIKVKKSIVCALCAVTISLVSVNAVIAKKKVLVRAPEHIEFEAEDGFLLNGVVSLPPKASVKKKVPMVILLHSLGQSKRAWGDIYKSINELGMASFMYDLRGHGESLYNENGNRRFWLNFKAEDFKKYPEDIHSAIKYIKESYPEVDTGNIAVVAGDIGANAAILAGSTNDEYLKTLVLLSPKMKYKHLETAIPLVHYGEHPVLIIVSKKDQHSYASALDLMKFAQGRAELVRLKFGGIGTDLLKNNPKTKKYILDWLEVNLEVKSQQEQEEEAILEKLIEETLKQEEIKELDLSNIGNPKKHTLKTKEKPPESETDEILPIEEYKENGNKKESGE